MDVQWLNTRACTTLLGHRLTEEARVVRAGSFLHLVGGVWGVAVETVTLSDGSMRGGLGRVPGKKGGGGGRREEGEGEG